MSAQELTETYWYRALSEEVERSWGQHRDFQHPETIADLCGYRMLTAFFDGSFEDVETRRELLYCYLEGPFGTAKASDLLNIHRHKLPVDSFIPKLLQNLCIAYNTPPLRTWRTKGAAKQEDKNATELYRQLYRDNGFDGKLQVAYRYMKLCSGVLLQPYVTTDGRMSLAVLPPDLCRFETDPMYPDRLTRVWLPIADRWFDADEQQWKQASIFQVWTDTDVWYEDAKGDRAYGWGEAPDDSGALVRARVQIMPNRYGRIPFIVARLVEPNDMVTFDGGLFTEVEANLRANALLFAEDCSWGTEAWAAMVAINMKLDGGGGDRLSGGWGTVFALENVQGGADGELPPSIDYVTTNGQYPQLGEYRDSYTKGRLRGRGLPDEVIDANASATSGIARKLSRMELTEQRDTDKLYLGTMEQQLSDVVAVVWNADVVNRPGGALRGAKPLPAPGTLELGLDWSDEKIYEEPTAALEHATKLYEAGHLSIAEYVRETTGREFPSEDEAAKFVADNLARKRTVEQGAPIDDTPTIETPAEPEQGQVDIDMVPDGGITATNGRAL